MTHHLFNARYLVNTSNGAMRNDRGNIVFFSTHSEARQFAINYADHSDSALEIIDIHKILNILINIEGTWNQY